jgi:hypothetical protein
MSTGKADIRIAVLDPTTSLWTHMANPLHHFGYAGSDEQERERMEQLKDDWKAIHIQLLQKRQDFDHLDPELLAEAAISDGRLLLGDAAYSVLVLPPLSNLEQAAWETVKQFAAAGGTVIGIGLLPYEVIENEGTAHGEALELFGLSASPQSWYWRGEQEAPMKSVGIAGYANVHFIPRQGGRPIAEAMERLIALLDEVLPPAVRLGDGGLDDAFLLQSRYLSDSEYAVFVSNQEAGSWETKLFADTDRIWTEYEAESREYVVELLDLETGAAERLETGNNSGQLIVPIQLASYASRLVRITRQTVTMSPMPSVVPLTWRWTIDADGPWRMTALDPNALRFDTFRLSIGGQEPVTVQAKTFIDQVSDHAEAARLPLSFNQTFGIPMKTQIAYPLPCRYTVTFDVTHVPDACALLMDETAISGDWTLTLNGTPLTRADFRRQNVYDYANFLCGVQTLIKPGRNELIVDVIVQHDWDGIVDALYLYGSFGASTNSAGEHMITQSPTTADTLAEDRYYPGYPYFAGTLSFKRSLDINDVPAAGRFELDFADWDVHDCVEVLVNGQSLGVRPWSPYIWQGDAALLHTGANEVEVRVTGTLIGLLEGKYFDYKSHRVESI